MNEFALNASKIYFPQLIYALIILILGLTIACIGRYILQHWFKFQNNKILHSFLVNLFFSIVLILTIITTLSKLGVPTASLVAIMGAASLAIGFALKDFLANIAAGFIIIFLMPFKVDDYVRINDEAGIILETTLFMTKLKTLTNECIFVPNNKVITNTILNYSYYAVRRVDLTIGVGYDTDLKNAKAIILQAIEQSEFTLKDPEPLVGVEELADSSINLLVRFWAKKENLVNAKIDLLENIRDRLNEAAINIPFPQLDIRLTDLISPARETRADGDLRGANARFP